MYEYFEQDVYQARTKAFPHLRRRGVVGIIQNGSRRRVYDCCVCGESISMCNEYPITERVSDFIANHEKRCGEKLLSGDIES